MEWRARSLEVKGRGVLVECRESWLRAGRLGGGQGVFVDGRGLKRRVEEG